MDLSIIVPIYNGEKYLWEALDSLASCPIQEMECIMVNDGSTDGSEAICQEYALHNPRFRLYSQNNAGVSAARNFGISQAIGNYIMFHDADDTLIADQWPVLAEELRKGQYDMVAYSYATEYASGRIERELFPIEEEFSDSHEDVWRILLGSPRLNTCWGKLLRRSLINEHDIRFKDGLKTGEDALFILDFLLYAREMTLSNQVVLGYRLHPSSAMQQREVREKLNDFSLLFQRRKEFAGEKGLEHLTSLIYKEAFSVLTNLYLEYSTKHSFKEIKREMSSNCDLPMVKDILAKTSPADLSPLYKRIELAFLKREFFTFAGIYFIIKTIVSRK